MGEMIQNPTGDKPGLRQALSEVASKLPVLWREPRDAPSSAGMGVEAPQKLPTSSRPSRPEGASQQPEPPHASWPWNRAASPRNRGATRALIAKHCENRAIGPCPVVDNRVNPPPPLRWRWGQEAASGREGNLGGDSATPCCASPAGRGPQRVRPLPKAKSTHITSSARARATGQPGPASDLRGTASNQSCKLSCRPINRHRCCWQGRTQAATHQIERRG